MEQLGVECRVGVSGRDGGEGALTNDTIQAGWGDTPFGWKATTQTQTLLIPETTQKHMDCLADSIRHPWAFFIPIDQIPNNLWHPNTSNEKEYTLIREVQFLNKSAYH